MTLTQFIAEIESDFKSFADSKSIDRVTIKLTVINELKRFGLNIAHLKEDIIDINNSMTFLPESFKSLKLALKLDPKGCKYEGDKENLTQDYIYKQRIENPAYFDEVNQEYVTSCNSKIITEKITIKDKKAEFFYDYQWLSLTKGISKDNLAIDCANIHPSIRNSYPNEISITNSILNTNFTSGTIYLQYYSLPVDEEGEIVIPETSTMALYRYIQNSVKTKIAEDLIANGDNPQGLGQLYSMWKQEQPFLRKEALVETKFQGLGKQWSKRLKALNRRDIQIFSLPSLKF
jgi:hypothetical protein